MRVFLSYLALTALLVGCSTNSKLPENCEIRVDGQCFQEAAPACAAAGCPDDCIILESYPGQVQCGDKAATTEQPQGAAEAVVLFVVSGHTQLGNTGKKTGYFLSEVAHPWHVLTQAGYAVEFVSPAGGKVEMDPKSRDLDDPINQQFVSSDDAKALEATMSPSDVEPLRYKAIYYAGGHGAMWDFPDATSLSAAAASIYDNGGIVAAVCHGPAGLVNIKLSSGQYLVAGKRVAAFTNAEEAAVGLTDEVPFLLADKLEERGAIHVPAADFQEQVVVDERLVTGQNPASAAAAGEAIVQLLSNAQ